MSKAEQETISRLRDQLGYARALAGRLMYAHIHNEAPDETDGQEAWRWHEQALRKPGALARWLRSRERDGR